MKASEQNNSIQMITPMQALQKTALVIIEDPKVRRFLKLALEDLKLTVLEHTDLKGAKAILQHPNAPALIVLDLGLQGDCEVQMIKEIKSSVYTKILVLCVSGYEELKARAFDAGADDYLTKPFGVDELQAHSKLLLSAIGFADISKKIGFGNVNVDLVQKTVTRGGEKVALSEVELTLLAHLITEPGQVQTQKSLVTKIWGGPYSKYVYHLHVYIARLRQKLEENSTCPKHLLTETGIGYRFQP